ncbi:ferritin-like domain-containing protein [Nocardiopsis xinjiangensis]|uniref:ferritin-like domain-containing protein n=1 Tax=Nocardiopsis xinjiangensis TaxID=124285 RepID=UPI00034C2DCE|nr:ferritin-like domain-containing protein [Nocardiopsis xinjiangensis]
MSEGSEAAGDAVSALAEALRAENAAVYAYEFVGGSAGDEDRRSHGLALASEHKVTRAELREAMLDREGSPPAVEPTYPLPSGRDGETLDDFAVGVENTCARAALWLTAADDTDLRTTGARLLQEATVRALEWGGELDSLPGFEGG